MCISISWVHLKACINIFCRFQPFSLKFFWWFFIRTQEKTQEKWKRPKKGKNEQKKIELPPLEVDQHLVVVQHSVVDYLSVVSYRASVTSKIHKRLKTAQKIVSTKFWVCAGPKAGQNTQQTITLPDCLVIQAKILEATY